MKKKRYYIKITITLSAFFLIFFSFMIFIVNNEKKKKDDMVSVYNREYLLSDKEIAERQVYYHDEDVVYAADLSTAYISLNEDYLVYADVKDGLYLPVDKTLNIKLNITDTGDYFILLKYTSHEMNLFDNVVKINLDNNEILCSMPVLFADDISEIRTDRYGNQIIQDQYQLNEPSLSYIIDYEHFNQTPIRFYLNKGEHEISITPLNQDMTILDILVIRADELISYDEYILNYKNYKDLSEIITIEGELYRAKSDSYIRGAASSNAGVVPNNPYIKLINEIDDESYKNIGQKIIYEVDIVEEGIYYLTFKYKQPIKTGGLVYRTIEVDGKPPFQEALDVGFTYTGNNKYLNHTLGGDTPYGIYLTKGIHTISLKITAGPMDELYNELLTIVEEINNTGIKLKKIKGSNSDDTAIDYNRTWDILQYMPDILENLNDWQVRITRVYEQLKNTNAMEPSFASDLMLAVTNLNNLAKNPREIPNKLSLLSDDSGSASLLISLTIANIYDQNLSIDRFYLHAEGSKLPSPSARIMTSILNGVKKFIYSFSPEVNEQVNINNSNKTLTVWMNKPAQYVDILRELTAQSFSKDTGIDVIFSIMPDEKKITLANSTKSNPDVALGVSYFRPAEFAMRNIVKNLLEYDDFLNWYCKEYNIESLTPMAYEDGIYGASETGDFYVLFYRSDILDMLGLSVPDTWEDVKKMMPVLHRNAMNFNLPLANNVGYKSFEATGGFVFQNNGNYYSEDGSHSNFNDINTIKGLKEMIELYQIYGLAQNIPNFFQAFRSGLVPIGVSNFSTYLQLKAGAKELIGRWDIALVPGTMSENGEILRYWSADATAAMIFSNTQMEDEAYEFLKWWLSSDTQVSYAKALQLRYGPDYIWNTANHAALNQMTYLGKHKDIILEQWSWQKEVLRHPASYILEREVSNAWIDIVTKGIGFQSRIDTAALISNREMLRKLQEFGYHDETGTKIKDYNVHLIDKLKKNLER